MRAALEVQWHIGCGSGEYSFGRPWGTGDGLGLASSFTRSFFKHLDAQTHFLT